MQQQYDWKLRIEKPLLGYENCMGVHLMRRLSNWLFAWWHETLCLRAAALSPLPLNGEGLPAPIDNLLAGETTTCRIIGIATTFSSRQELAGERSK